MTQIMQGACSADQLFITDFSMFGQNRIIKVFQLLIYPSENEDLTVDVAQVE